MAYADSRLGYHVQQTDRKHSHSFDDEDSPAVLDPTILDSAIMQSPSTSTSQFRKPSFVNSNGVLSPADSHAWDHQYAGVPVEAAPSHSYHDGHDNFARRHVPHALPPAYAHPAHPEWSLEPDTIAADTPITGIDYISPPPPFDAHPFPPSRADSAHGSLSHAAPPPPILPINASHPESDLVLAPQVRTPMSPHSHQDWMGLAQQEMESRPLPKRMRPNTPHAPVADLARRDGIRKKNGRIDIPQERNIHTIDEMIDKTNDENLLKELKQQKRLLRNREAALASRQRKKKHTEDLEVKEKGYTHQINMLEKEISDLTIDNHRREDERQMLVHRFQESQRFIETLHDQIREMQMQHNEETSNLRRKINILTDQLAAGPAPAMSAAPSSTGFTDFNAEMEALNMEPHDWDNFVLVEGLHNNTSVDFAFNPEHGKPPAARGTRPLPGAVVEAAPKKSADTDQPIASGLLFMLLLCGAFIASKPAHSQPRDMPKMPAEVCAAAPTVLNNLLSESGPRPSPTNARTVHAPGQGPPSPSARPYLLPSTNSRLDQLHQRLTSPSKQQEIDQAFALTTAQYASITHMDYPSPYPDHDAAPRPRRNLADALALDEHAPPGSKAEVYTRSLLWDQIPADVVKQFREMVRECDEIDSRRQQQRPQQLLPQQQRRRTRREEMFGYKIEG